MIIWKASMRLICNIDNNWELSFDFCKQEEEYRDNGDEWIYTKDWVATRIPKEIKIRNSYGNIIAEIGFDIELIDNDIKTLKSKMRDAILDFIEEEKENYLNTVDNKIQALHEGILI